MQFIVLDESIAVDLGPDDRNWDSSDQDWFYINNGVWYVNAGVIWDGATAVPDGGSHPDKPGYPLIWLATLIHDLGYMFMIEEDFPYTRKEIDKLFKRLMDEAGFSLSLIYFLGVRHFGGIWNFIFNIYRTIWHKERQLPAHLDEYTLTEISVYT